MKLTALLPGLIAGVAMALSGCGGGGGSSNNSEWYLFLNSNSPNGGTVYEHNRTNGLTDALLNFASGTVSNLNITSDGEIFSVMHQYPDTSYEGVVRYRDGSDEFIISDAKLIAISPNGNQLAIVELDNDVVLGEIDGSNRQTIYNAGGTGGPTSLAWSRSGDTLVLTTNMSGWFQVTVVDAAPSSSPTYLTPTGESCYNARYSPDGLSIVYESNKHGNNEIYIMDWDGTDTVRLTNNSGDDGQPTFNADGTKILFRSFRDGLVDIYEMDLDGANQVRAISETLNESWPIPG